MNDLQILNHQGKLVVDSREVAHMIGKRHSDLLRDIRNFSDILGKRNFALTEFFIESKYVDSQGKERVCYLLTRKGCDMVANKLTGEKGVVFTAKYVTKFEEMEKVIKEANPYLLGTSKELQAIFLLDKKQQHFDTRLTNLENSMTIDFGQQRNLQTIAQQKAIDQLGGKDTAAYQNKSLRTKVFSAIWKDYKDYFQVASYRDTLKTQYERAIEFLNDWRLTGKLLREVEECNNQLIMNLQEA